MPGYYPPGSPRLMREDPMNQCTFTPGAKYPFNLGLRRVGSPKHNWTFETYERIVKLNNRAITNDTWKRDPYTYIDQVQASIMARTVKV